MGHAKNCYLLTLMASNKVASIVAQDTVRLSVYRLSTVHSVRHAPGVDPLFCSKQLRPLVG